MYRIGSGAGGRLCGKSCSNRNECSIAHFLVLSAEEANGRQYAIAFPNHAESDAVTSLQLHFE